MSTQNTCAACGSPVFWGGWWWWERDGGEQHTPARCRAFRAANGQGSR